MLREKLYKKREESYTNSQRSLAHKLGDCKQIKKSELFSVQSGRSREHNIVGILHTTPKESCKQHLEESCTKHLIKVGGLLLTTILEESCTQHSEKTCTQHREESCVQSGRIVAHRVEDFSATQIS